MDFRQFRYFVATAEELHFAKAAERLGITQPVLSQQIKVLENQLGGKLFSRERRRVELTEMGSVFLIEARLALAAADRAVQLAKDISRGTSGRIDVGIVGSVMYEPDLPQLLSVFCQSHPEVQVTLNEMPVPEQVEAVRTRHLDLAVVREPIPVRLLEGLQSFVVSTQQIVAAVPARHRLAACDAIHLGDLAQDPFLGFSDPDGIGMHQALLDLCRHAGFEPRFAQKTKSPTTVVSLVGAGFGVGLVVDIVKHLQIPGVRYLPLLDMDATSRLILVHRRFERSAVVNALLGTIRDFVRQKRQRSDN